MLGQTVHAALAAYYADGVRDFTDTLPETANEMVTGYIEWAETEGVDAGMRVLSVEAPLQGTIGGVPFRARVDLILQDTDTGAVYLLDHKTVGSMGAYPLHMDGQLMTYVLLAREVGLGRAHYAGHNLLRRVKRRSSAREPFYRRDIVTFSDRQLTAHADRLVRIVDRITEDDLHVPVVDQSCAWGCPFIAICPLVDDGCDAEQLLQAMSALVLTRQNQPATVTAEA